MVTEATKMRSSLIGCKLDRKRKPSPNLQKIRKQNKQTNKKNRNKNYLFKGYENKYIIKIKRNKQKQILEDEAQ